MEVPREVAAIIEPLEVDIHTIFAYPTTTFTILRQNRWRKTTITTKHTKTTTHNPLSVWHNNVFKPKNVELQRQQHQPRQLRRWRSKQKCRW